MTDRKKVPAQKAKKRRKQRIQPSKRFKRAAARQTAIMEKGFDLGTKGEIGISREELHDRRL